MQAWTTLVKTALLGTDRQKLQVPGVGGAVDALVALIGADTPEHALLATAAVLAPYRRAGLIARRTSVPPVEPAPPETQPPLPPAASDRLAMLLANHHGELLPEFLTLTARAGYRLPARYLPAILDQAADAKALRPLVAPLLGHRGQWLISEGKNPRWQFAEAACAQTIEQTWDTGPQPARLGAFKHLRQTDPDRARALLEKTWDQETADDRAAFVAAMSIRLAMADEPFLESALDDRRKEVRDAAAELLSCLPMSRLVQRMTTRAARILGVVTAKKSRLLGLGKGKTQISLDVNPPAECDKEMIRDGVDPKPKAGPRTTMGQKAWWTMQVLAAVPPSRWSSNAGAAPQDLVAAVSKSEWEEALLAGWATAAARHNDAAWAEALLVTTDLDPDLTQRLFNILPAERACALLLDLLGKDPDTLRGDHPLFTVLLQADIPWNDALARKVIAGVRQSIARPRGQDQDWYLMQHMTSFARRIPPHLYPDFAKDWPTDAKKWPQWQQVIDRFLAILQFRHDMCNDLKTNQ